MFRRKTLKDGAPTSAALDARGIPVDAGSDMMRWFNGLQVADQTRVALAWQHGWFSGWDDSISLHHTACPFVPDWGPADG